MYLRKFFWIDAICIDQDSNLEKTHQVAQMGKVYKNANRIIMWLGIGYEDCELSIKSHCIFSKSLRHYIPFDIHNEYWKRAWILQ